MIPQHSHTSIKTSVTSILVSSRHALHYSIELEIPLFCAAAHSEKMRIAHRSCSIRILHFTIMDMYTWLLHWNTLLLVFSYLLPLVLDVILRHGLPHYFGL